MAAQQALDAQKYNEGQYKQKAMELIAVLQQKVGPGARIYFDYPVIKDYFGFSNTNATVKEFSMLCWRWLARHLVLTMLLIPQTRKLHSKQAWSPNVLHT